MEFERVKNVIVDQLSVDADEVTLEASFVDDLGADSLDVVELIMGLETEFDIEIPDEDAEKISTVGDAVEYIKSSCVRYEVVPCINTLGARHEIFLKKEINFII